MHINAKTMITCLIGYPVEHSLSPDMHNASFEALGLNYCYIALPVHPDSLPSSIEGLRALNFRGANVTVPHKEKVISLLDEVDEEAKFIGAVNTIVNNSGILKGYNTDGRGFMKSLDENGIEVNGKDIFLVGAGGAARAIGYYLCKRASNLYISDIDKNKASSLSMDLRKINSSVFFTEEKDKLHTADIIINATPLGLKPDDPLPFETDRVFSSQVIIDLIYKNTPVLKRAAGAGCKTLNGLGMLLWQGVLAFQLWTGISPPVEIMRNTLIQGFSQI